MTCQEETGQDLKVMDRQQAGALEDACRILIRSGISYARDWVALADSGAGSVTCIVPQDSLDGRGVWAAEGRKRHL